MTDHEATAKKICGELTNISFASLRDRIDCYEIIEKAVAAALTERDAAEAKGFVRGLELACQIADLEITQPTAFGVISAEIAEVQKRHDDLWEMDRKIIADLKAERDAALRERDDWKIAHAIEDETGVRLVEDRDQLRAQLDAREKEDIE